MTYTGKREFCSVYSVILMIIVTKSLASSSYLKIPEYRFIVIVNSMIVSPKGSDHERNKKEYLLL